MISINKNSCYNGEYIVSYDSKKTWIINRNNSLIFCKKTNFDEVDNIKYITKLISNEIITISGKKYILGIPRIINWDSASNILYLEYCEGENLEFYLRSETRHFEGRDIINGLLDFFIKNKIFWIDFAPRNIIINSDKIFIVDFEKGILSSATPLVEYFRNHVYEEYCLFLLKSERKKYFDNIFYVSEQENLIFDLEKIESDRFREIAKMLGYTETITKREYLQILKIVTDVEEPYIKDGKFVFPGVILDKFIINNKSLNPIIDYAREVLRLYKIKNKKVS